MCSPYFIYVRLLKISGVVLDTYHACYQLMILLLFICSFVCWFLVFGVPGLSASQIPKLFCTDHVTHCSFFLQRENSFFFFF